MNGGHRRGYAFVVAAVIVIGGSIFLYKVRPLAGIAFGSTAVVVAVLAHLGVIAAVFASIVALRRRPHQNRARRSEDIGETSSDSVGPPRQDRRK